MSVRSYAFRAVEDDERAWVYNVDSSLSGSVTRVTHDSKLVEFALWDTAGQVRLLPFPLLPFPLFIPTRIVACTVEY